MLIYEKCSVQAQVFLISVLKKYEILSAVTEVRECLLPLGAEPFVFQFAIQKFKDQDI